MKYVTAFDPVLVLPSIIGTVRVCVTEVFHKFVVKPEMFLFWWSGVLFRLVIHEVVACLVEFLLFERFRVIPL